jgi:D-amino-acid oxidase
VRRVVTSLAAEPGDFVVNCAGLGARELAGDDSIYPLFGQVVVTEPGAADLTTTITDHRNSDDIFYIIPRRSELVLGGCSRPYPPGAPPELDHELTARILRQAQGLGIPIGATRAERAGLRPYRLEVRLERWPRHPLRHGGGCAEDVCALLT